VVNVTNGTYVDVWLGTIKCFCHNIWLLLSKACTRGYPKWKVPEAFYNKRKLIDNE